MYVHVMSNGFINTFKLLHKESIDTVDRSLVKWATKYSDISGLNFSTILAITFSNNGQGMLALRVLP